MIIRKMFVWPIAGAVLALMACACLGPHAAKADVTPGGFLSGGIDPQSLTSPISQSNLFANSYSNVASVQIAVDQLPNQ